MRVSFATRPGSAEKPTEDFLATDPSVALVLDGLTSPPELGTGCVHGTPWFVAQLGTHLLHGATTRPEAPLADIVADAIEAVAGLHSESCDLMHPGTPSCSVALLREGPQSMDYLAIFDSVIVLDGANPEGGAHESDGSGGAHGPTIITDLRVDSYAQEEHKATQQYLIGTEEHRQAVSRLVAAQRPYRNQPHGYWVAAATPQSAYEAVTGSVPRSSVARAAVLSDGASCLVDRYATTDWRSLMDLLDTHGPAEAIAQVRQAEAADPLGTRWPRYKRSDDSTVVYCVLDQ